jgi:hypothetical protein
MSVILGCVDRFLNRPSAAVLLRLPPLLAFRSWTAASGASSYTELSTATTARSSLWWNAALSQTIAVNARVLR